MIQVRAMAARITCADDHAASTSLARQRGAVLDELLDVCAAVWGPDPVSYTGALTTIAPSEVGPKPARPIPVRLAGEQRPYFPPHRRPRRWLDPRWAGSFRPRRAVEGAAGPRGGTRPGAADQHKPCGQRQRHRRPGRRREPAAVLGEPGPGGGGCGPVCRGRARRGSGDLPGQFAACRTAGDGHGRRAVHGSSGPRAFDPAAATMPSADGGKRRTSFVSAESRVGLYAGPATPRQSDAVQPGRADREEQVRIDVTAGGILRPVLCAPSSR